MKLVLCTFHLYSRKQCNGSFCISVSQWEAHICFISVPCLFHACFTLVVTCLSLLAPAVCLLATQLLCATLLSSFQLVFPYRYILHSRTEFPGLQDHIQTMPLVILTKTPHHVSGLASLTSRALGTLVKHVHSLVLVISVFLKCGPKPENFKKVY